jgi:predicted transcriptional regulator
VPALIHKISKDFFCERHKQTSGGGTLKSKSHKKKKSHGDSSNIEFELDLLQRHMSLLKAIIENEPIGIIRLSELLDCPQHKVRYSLRILEQESLIKPSLEGAVTTDNIDKFLGRLSNILDGIVISVRDIDKSLK